jgi:isoamylase
MPLNFFSPHQGYAVASDAVAARAEFKAMVKALHRAGIEVILDVVYNHTNEAGAEGPNYSYQGICNGSYYLLKTDMTSYRDDTGTGNVLRSAHPAVRKMIIDSRRLWARDMDIDGFRLAVSTSPETVLILMIQNAVAFSWLIMATTPLPGAKK